MAAIGMGGNLQFFPLAYGIVETKNHEAWTWFMEQLKDTIGERYKGQPWIIMSDRQKVKVHRLL